MSMITDQKSAKVHILLSGQIPNRRGQPLIHRWLGVRFIDGTFNTILTLEEVLKRTQIHEKDFSNPQTPFDTDIYSKLLPEAVKRGTEWLMNVRKEFLATTMPEVNKKLSALESLEAKHQQQLELEFADIVAGASKKDRKLREVKHAFADYRAWIESTLTIEEHGHLVVAMVMSGGNNG